MEVRLTFTFQTVHDRLHFPAHLLSNLLELEMITISQATGLPFQFNYYCYYSKTSVFDLIKGMIIIFKNIFI